MYIYITQWNPSEKSARDNQYLKKLDVISQLEKGEQIVDICH